MLKIQPFYKGLVLHPLKNLTEETLDSNGSLSSISHVVGCCFCLHDLCVPTSTPAQQLMNTVNYYRNIQD